MYLSVTGGAPTPPSRGVTPASGAGAATSSPAATPTAAPRPRPGATWAATSPSWGRSPSRPASETEHWENFYANTCAEIKYSCNQVF